MLHDERLRQAMQPDWGELRERRVIARALRQLQMERVPRWSRARRWLPVVAVAACLALTAAFVFRRHTGVFAKNQALRGVARLSLLEGSTALVGVGAQVKVEERQGQRIVVSQAGGRVDYDVRHDPQREFLVRAGDVLIRDLGTQFAVEFTGSSLEISVQQGRVEVLDGDRRQELETGESVRVQLGVAKAPAPPIDDRPMPDAPTSSQVPQGTLGPSAGLVREGGPEVSPAATTTSSGSWASDTPESLLERSDAARVSGRLQDSAAALRQFVRLYPQDRRAAGAWFALGKVEASRGAPAAAAAAYARAAGLGGHGTLAEDAVAEEAEAWLSSGQRSRAVSAARGYLDRYPRGVHAARMSALLE